MSSILIPAFLFVAFGLVEVLAGRFRQPKAQRDDAKIELGGMLSLGAVAVPLSFVAVNALGEHFLPAWKDRFVDLPWWAMALAFVCTDDLAQYWWHRTAHAFPFLYQFHRAHHSAEYMSVRIVYRNNLFYYIFLPGLWITAALTFLGFGMVYPFYSLAKLTVIVGAHSSVPWDRFLYRHKFLSPLAWVIERTISTPATHYAHHGLHSSDGVTHYKGNYGNMLFLWDVIFGTAKITRRYPTEFGIENLVDAPWTQELFYPLVPETASARATVGAGD